MVENKKWVNFFTPSEGMSLVAHKNVATDWLDDNKNVINEVSFNKKVPTEVLMEIAQNAPYFVVKNFFRNHYFYSTEVLDAIFLNKSFSIQEVNELIPMIARHENTSPEMLERIFYYAEHVTLPDTLYYLVKNPNTPANVLRKFLPQNGAYKHFAYNEIVHACKNLSTPHGEALIAAKLLRKPEHVEAVWEKHFPLFTKEYIRTHNTNVGDWPEEWVTEILYNIHLPINNEIRMEDV